MEDRELQEHQNHVHHHDHDHDHEAHDHHHEGECCCGHAHHDHDHDHHDHDHAHDHEAHDHHHEGECCCGHDHHDHDHHDHDHDHDHHHEDHQEAHELPAGIPQRVYILENLDCANCAAKMERKINQLPEVTAAAITFATKKLVVASEYPGDLLPLLQKACSSIEAEVVVAPQEETGKKQTVKKGFFEEHKGDILVLGGGAVLFAAGLLAGQAAENDYVSGALFIAAYLILGLEIIRKAFKNLRGGHLFDENFLMSIATLAAFAIGDFAEAVGVMLFYRVGEFFEDVAVERSRSQIMEAVDMRPETVNLVSGEDVREIPAGEAKPGDIIVIRPGDRVPLDSRVVEGESRIDTSPVTGEPVPVRAYPGAELISGCVNGQGVLRAEVLKPLSESMVTRILDSVEHAAASKPKIDRFITRFARIYTPVVVAAAILTAVVPSLMTGDWNHWIYTAITFLVISCPCALVLSVPLAFFSGIGAGSKKGILFKGGVAIEALKNVRAIVMDKTGTLTEGKFEVQKTVSVGRLTEKQILTIAADCELDSTHPIADSIVREAGEKGLSLVRPREAEEISGKGIRAGFAEGTALCGNEALLEMYGVDTSVFPAGESGTKVYIAVDGKAEGYLVIDDVIKKDAGAAVEEMRRMNLTAAILTGDAPESAQAVAGRVGIGEVHAQLLPQEKLTALQKIRQRYGAVMFVGDGINDAPVLAGADVGAAMGSGADAAIEAADVVFMTSGVQAIPDSVRIARSTGSVAVQNVVFALLIKLFVMILGLLGHANMWMAVFADTGVAMLCVLNSIRVLYKKY